MDDINNLTHRIIGICCQLHTDLGPGLLESSYKACLDYELRSAGLFVETEKPLPLIYKDVRLDVGYRIDLFIEKKVIVEIKAVESLNNVHMAQVLTYMKLTGCKVGFADQFQRKTSYKRCKKADFIKHLPLLCVSPLCSLWLNPID